VRGPLHWLYWVLTGCILLAAHSSDHYLQMMPVVSAAAAASVVSDVSDQWGRWLLPTVVLGCRAFYSLRKCGIEADDVRMAVCVMRVVPARYAFVIHTKNPSNNDANEVRAQGSNEKAQVLYIIDRYS